MFTEHRTIEVTVLTEQGHAFVSFLSRYNALTKVNALKATLLDSLGNVKKRYKESNFLDMSAFGVSDAFYSDDRLKVFKVDGLKPPYTIRYEYRKKYQSLFLLPIWTPTYSYSCPVEKAVFCLQQDILKGELVKSKSYYFPQNPQSYSQLLTKSTKTEKWVLEGLKGKVEEPLMSMNLEQNPYLSIVADSFVLAGKIGSSKSWSSFGEVFYDLNDPEARLDDATVQKVQSLVLPCKTEKEKVEVLYKYLQGSTRYLLNSKGYLGWQSARAMDVAKAGYGVCKGLTTFMRGLLKAAGIKAYATLVASGSEVVQFLDTEFPQNVFNLVILCVPLKDDTVWLESTSKYMEMGFLGNATHGRRVLVLTENGGRLATTPLYNTDECALNVVIKAGFDVEHKVQVTDWQADYVGDFQFERAAALATLNKADSVKFLLQSMPFKNHEITSYTHQMATSSRYVPTMKEHIKLSSLGVTSLTQKRIMVELPKFAMSLPLEVADTTTRNNDFEFNDNYKVIYQYQFECPEGYTLENGLKVRKLVLPFASFHYSPKISGNRLFIDVSMRVKKGIYPQASFEEFKNFHKEVLAATQARTLSFVAQ